jgi:hypothetical protein
MTDGEWDDLLKLRNKALLSEQIDNSLQRLENFLCYSNYLSSFSQDEKNRLLHQFSELSDQEKQDLWHRATNRTGSAFFHLTQEEIDKLLTARKTLSFHERAQLSDRLILTAAGTAWLDLGDVFEAQIEIIEIDDNSSPERASRPHARISFYPHTQNHVQIIDIIESVKNNPLAIGHPAIMYAIYNWQQVIHAKRVIERDDVTSRDEIGQVAKQVFGGGREVEIAKRNLKRISQVLVEGANKRALSKEAAFAANVELLGLGLEGTDSFLHKAWERLAGDFVEKVLEKIETELRALERLGEVNTPGRIPISRVMGFLKDGGQKGGRKFVAYNEEGVSSRPAWKVFRNAFLAWFYDLEQGSVQQYLEDAAKTDIDVDNIFQPTFNNPITTVHRIWQHVLEIPLTIISEPDVSSEEGE